MKNQRGIVWPPVLIIVVVLAVVGIAGYLFFQARDISDSANTNVVSVNSSANTNINSDAPVSVILPEELQSAARNDCTSLWSSSAGIKRCNRFRSDNLDTEFYVMSADSEALRVDSEVDISPTDVLATATNSIKTESQIINERQWFFDWRQGSSGCDGAYPSGCEKITLMAYTKEGTDWYIFTDSTANNTEVSSTQKLSNIITNLIFN